MNTPIIERVRALVGEGKMTRAGLARAAGLHANTLRDCVEDSWNPTAETLGKLERFLSQNDETPVLVPIEAIIDEARNGRMFVLIDDEDRENEGDLVIPAQMATPDAINFMATHGRGLICLCLALQRVEALGLQPMSRTNRSRMETAFTTSIEARDQREHVTGADDVVRPLGRVDRDRNRPRPVGRADAGGHALARLDRGGEGGFHPAAVGAAHRLQPERLDPLEREA